MMKKYNQFKITNKKNQSLKQKALQLKIKIWMNCLS